MAKRRLCVVGGGASGLCLAWLATRSAQINEQWEVTVLHDEPALGGHSHTIPVQIGERMVPVDIGVQFVSPTVYPHVTADRLLPQVGRTSLVATTPTAKRVAIRDTIIS